MIKSKIYNKKSLLIFYTLMLLFGYLFGIGNIHAKIESFVDSGNTAPSGGCNETNACASDIRDSGIRVTLVDSNGNNVAGKDVVNFWSSYSVYNYVKNGGGSIEVNPSENSDYTCSSNQNLIKDGYIGSNVYDSTIYLPNAETYRMYNKWLTDYIIGKNTAETIVKKMLYYLNNTKDITNYDEYYNYYLKLEPVYVIKEIFWGPCFYFAGTTKEIISNWGNFSKYQNITDKNGYPIYNSYGDFYIGGRGTKDILGKVDAKFYVYNEWNVLRNYILAMYNPCSSGLTFNCTNISKDVLGKYRDYKSNNSNYSDTYKLANLNDLYLNKTGLGVGYLKLSEVLPPKGSIKIIKTDESGNQINGAVFDLYKDSNCSNIFKEGITVNKTETISDLIPGTYYIKETQAPNGYLADNSCYSVKVESGKTAKITIKNKKIEEKVVIQKVDSKGRLISSGDVTIKLYTGSIDCFGNNTSKTFNKSLGLVLTPGNYSVQETEAPSGYKLDTTCHTIVVANAGEVYIDGEIGDKLILENQKKGCNDELNAYKTTYGKSNIPPDKLIELFNKYKGTDTFKTDPPYGLLDFNDPNCDVDRSCKSFSSGCLSANSVDVNFNEKNLSCFDSYISDSSGNYVGFCKKEVNIINSLGVNKFYSTSGKFLIKYVVEDNNIYYYSLEDAATKKLKLKKSTNNLLATAIHEETCYLVGDGSKTFSSADIEMSFGDNNADGVPDNLSKTKGFDKKYGPYKVNNLNLIIYQEGYYFQLKDSYYKKITGKNTNETFATDKITGIVSPFNKQSGTIPFSMKYDGKTYSSAECSYETFEEIIDPKIPKEKLKLEFRTIDTTNPFIGKNVSCRNTNSNWCDGSDCSCKNDIVKNTIQKSVNSYGMKNGVKREPIYKITLTPNDIKKIRKYNQENKYDNYIMIKIDKNGVKKYVNKFLYELFNGKITLNKTTETTQMKLEGNIKEVDVETTTPSAPAINLPISQPIRIPKEQQTQQSNSSTVTTYIPKSYTDSSGSLDAIKSSTSGFNNITSGKHTFQLNTSSKLKSCIGYNQNIRVTGTTSTWTLNDTCKINLSDLAPEPVKGDSDVHRYYYTYSVTLENGKTYKSCMRVAVWRIGAYGVVDRDAEVKHDNCCLDPNFGKWHNNNC